MVTLACGAGLAAVLLVLALVDWRRQILPDLVTLPLSAAGLLVAWGLRPETLASHGLAAAAGWAAFAGLAAFYRRWRGRDGLGGGDAKLAAAAGAWVGLEGLPWVVLLAALAGLMAVAVLAVFRRGWEADRRLPFGPFLGMALWAVWVAGAWI